MPKWIMLSMALMLAGAGAQAMEGGGVDASMDDSAHAVDETKMDVAMMEDGPEVMDGGMPVASAPSVALSGEAKMGLKRVDDNASKDPEDDDIKTVVEYEVEFSSSGVTDGGLVFGAAISIDEDGKGAAGSNGVNEASVHIGGADGTWKLQFGNNDPGIDLVGNIGVADADNISGMTLTLVPLTWGDKMEQVYMSSAYYPDFTVGEKGIAYIPPGGVPRVINKTSTLQVDQYFDAQGNYDPLASDKPVKYIKQAAGGVTYTSIRSNVGAMRNLFFRDVKGTNMPAPPPGGHTAMALTGTIDSFSYALTASEAGEDTWSAGVKYDAGAFYVSAGMDYNDVKAIGAGGTLAGFTGKATYVKQDAEPYWTFIHAFVEASTGYSSMSSKLHAVNDMEAYGLSVSRDIGSGSNVTLAYSRLTDKIYKPTFIGTKQWELDFTYDLGGGASFYAGIEQANKSELDQENPTGVSEYAVQSKYTVVSNGDGKAATYTPISKTSKVTTIELGITMTF